MKTLLLLLAAVCGGNANMFDVDEPSKLPGARCSNGCAAWADSNATIQGAFLTFFFFFLLLPLNHKERGWVPLANTAHPLPRLQDGSEIKIMQPRSGSTVHSLLLHQVLVNQPGQCDTHPNPHARGRRLLSNVC